MNLSNIVGSGFIAKSFKNKNNFFKKKKCILYAAGVSNSNCKDLELYKKDFKRLKFKINSLNHNKLIYLSSCSVADKSRNKSLYLKSKIKNENYIKKNCKKYLIIRLPEIIGKNKNKHTLVNYFYYKIKNKEKINLYKNAKRNFMYIYDILEILVELINKNISNKIINIASPKMTNVYKIVLLLEKILKKKAIINFKKKNNSKYKISIKNIIKFRSFKKINFNDKYLYNNLKRYNESI